MILVDTSVWVDHLRRGDQYLSALLESAAVFIHPFVIGEIACGRLANRHLVIELLRDLPMINIAEPDEVLAFIESSHLHDTGIGYVDMHLLAAVALTDGARLWTRDKRLRRAADALDCAFREAGSH